MSKKDFVDDGRTIANMNIEGIRGYHKEEKTRDMATTQQTDKSLSKDPQNTISFGTLSFREKLAFASGVLGAACLVIVIFIAIFLAAILFTSKIWLH